MYDHIEFHIDESYPNHFPRENAVIHMGFYWKWAASNHLVNNAWQESEHTKKDFSEMLEGKISGADFIMNHMNACLTRSDFNEDGIKFTDYYYDDEDEGYGKFLEDYVTTMNTPELDSFYHVEDSSQNFEILSKVFQNSYSNWKKSLK